MIFPSSTISDRPSGPDRVLGQLEHPFLLELGVDDPKDLRLAARRKPADDQVLADRGREWCLTGTLPSSPPRSVLDAEEPSPAT